MEPAGEESPVSGLEAFDRGPEGPEVPLARITDRFLAYILDALLFFIPCRLTLKLAPGLSEAKWHFLWVGLYTFYQAVLNSGGRAPLGKALLGLRVVTTDGEPLGFGRSLVRALGYIPSGAAFELGFVWAWAHPMRRGWHDLLAGTLVVETGERPAAFRALSSVLSVVVLLVLAGLTGRRMLFPPPTAAGRAALEELAWLGSLEEQHMARTGKYTDDPTQLARLAGGVGPFRERLSAVIRPDGFGLSVSDSGYVIVARAQDGSEVRFRGPRK